MRIILEIAEGQKLIQPKLDKYFNKGLETWKQNNLEKLIDEEIAKRYPEETPEMRRIKELEQKLAEKERESVRKEFDDQSAAVSE